MKKIIFFVLILFNYNLFSSETLNNSLSQEFLINDALHKLLIKKAGNYFRFNLNRDDKLIGYLCAEQKKDSCKITELYINKEFRNQGYGKSILQFVCNYFNKYEVCKFRLLPVAYEIVNGIDYYFEDDPIEEEKQSVILKAFYTKFGFVKKEIYMELNL